MSNRTRAQYREVRQVIFEQRFLLGCTVFLGLSIFVWATAISTDYWLIAQPPNEEPIVINDATLRDRIKVFQGGHLGLFRVCTYGYTVDHLDSTERIPYKECVQNKIFLRQIVTSKHRPKEKLTLINYSKTDVSFAIISMFLMTLGFTFSICSCRNRRYMFKRLTGGIHFITSMCMLVVIHMLISLEDYGSKQDNWVFPKYVDINYGFSLILALLVFLDTLFSACAFMVLSRKRKRERAPIEEFAMADEPIIIGR